MICNCEKNIYIHILFIYPGPLTSTVGVSYLAFLKGRKIHSSLDIPNYELYFSEMPTSIVKKQFGLKPEVSIINYLCLESSFILFIVSTKLTFPLHHSGCGFHLLYITFFFLLLNFWAGKNATFKFRHIPWLVGEQMNSLSMKKILSLF